MTAGNATRRLTYRHLIGVIICVKTARVISDALMERLRREAARQGRTMSKLVEKALWAMFQSRGKTGRLPRLPEFSMGGGRVNVADREVLYEVMER